jgi:hypothetical protein
MAPGRRAAFSAAIQSLTAFQYHTSFRSTWPVASRTHEASQRSAVSEVMPVLSSPFRMATRPAW